MRNREELLTAIRDESVDFINSWLENRCVEYAENYEVVTRLVAAGVMQDTVALETYIQYGTRHFVPAEKLPEIRKHFDKVADSGEREVSDAAENLVRVFLDLGFEHASVRLYYVKKLEADSKCRIEPQVTTEHKLVCSV